MFAELYPGAKVSPESLIQSLGASGRTSPDNIISSEIVVNNGIDRCGFMKPNDVYCPVGWSPTPVRTFDPNRKDEYYCFKNAGLSYGNVDLCPSEGGQRIWFPANGLYNDLFKILKGNNCFCVIFSSSTLFIFYYKQSVRFTTLPSHITDRYKNRARTKETFG